MHRLGRALLWSAFGLSALFAVGETVFAVWVFATTFVSSGVFLSCASVFLLLISWALLSMVDGQWSFYRHDGPTSPFSSVIGGSERLVLVKEDPMTGRSPWRFWELLTTERIVRYGPQRLSRWNLFNIRTRRSSLSEILRLADVDWAVVHPIGRAYFGLNIKARANVRVLTFVDRDSAERWADAIRDLRRSASQPGE